MAFIEMDFGGESATSDKRLFLVFFNDVSNLSFNANVNEVMANNEYVEVISNGINIVKDFSAKIFYYIGGGRTSAGNTATVTLSIKKNGAEIEKITSPTNAYLDGYTNPISLSSGDTLTFSGAGSGGTSLKSFVLYAELED